MLVRRILKMEESFLELVDEHGTESGDLNITEYHPDYMILSDHSEKSSSGVWKHFGALKHNDVIDRKHFYCIQCFCNRKIKKYQRSTSTGNLSKHLKKHHSISLQKTFRVKISEADNSIVLVHKEEDDSDKYDDNLMNNSSNAESGDEFHTNDINDILIQEVAKRPLLYKSHACQQEKGVKHQIRRQLWNEIYESLQHHIDLDKIPKIWKNIRDRYHKVRRQIESQPDAIKPKYRYNDALQFLDPTADEQKSDEAEKRASLKRKHEYTAEETDADDYQVTGDHDHYISSEAIVLPSENITYEEVNYEPIVKKIRTSPRKPKDTAYKVINQIVSPNVDRCKAASTKPLINIMEEEFIDENMPSESEILAVFEQDSVEELELLDSCNANDPEPIVEKEEKRDSVSTTSRKNIGNSNKAQSADDDATAHSKGKQDQFDMFANFVAQVMRDMTKAQSRKLQMNILKLISESEMDQ